MANFRSLQRIIRNSNITSLSLPSPSSPPPFTLHHRNHFLSPLHSDVIVVFPFHGPLFLSSPPWKLSQSATPLLIQSDVVLPRLDALKLLQRTKVEFPIKLGFRKAADERRDSDDAEVIVSGNDGGFVKSFVNLPNFVSFSRMLSGPLLGWMIVNEWYLPAFVGLAVSGASDWLDGFPARKMGINSV